jgi:N utilization substance protein B
MKRRLARKHALNILYRAELRPDEPIDKIIAEFWRDKEPEPDVRRFAEILVRGTIQHLPKIDDLIEEYCEHWEIHRMATIDRCILRFAAFEILYLADIPPAVTINEAIEIAKEFSTEDSSKFINALLDRIKDRVREIEFEHLMTSGGEM